MEVEKRDNEKAKLPLIEKYRPVELKEIVSHDDIINTIEKFLQKDNIPHLLFHGPPGTGKTSCIMSIARRIYGKDMKHMVLDLNASDDRGINTVRTEIKEFCSAHSFVMNKHPFKLVILDEADMLTTPAQNALRRLIEKYTKNVRFCLICNQVSKIISAIQSRCLKFRFKPLKKEYCFSRLKQICQYENYQLKGDEEEIFGNLISISRGDMRKILNLIESTALVFNKEISLRNICSVAGIPTKDDIDNIIQTIKNDQIADSYKNLMNLKIEKGFTIIDIINQIIFALKTSNKISSHDKLDYYQRFSEVEYSEHIGGNEGIMVSNIISLIKELC